MRVPPPPTRRQFLQGTALATMALAAGVRANAQPAYPGQPIRLVVPFSPGGAVDIYSRIMSPELSKELGQTIIVENRPGASGNIGAELVKRAAPDGYTLLVGNIAILGINPVVYKNNPIDPLADLAPITKTVNVNYVLVVNPQVPARTAAELIAYAKANPGKLTYGSSGTGSMQQMAAELFQSRTGTKLLHVPYKGTGALVGDLVAGHVDMIFADQGSMMQQVNAGKLVVLGVCGLTRRPEYPDIPTIAEAANLPGFEAVAWQGLAGPAGLPAPIVDRLNQAFNKIQAEPAIKARLAEAGLTTDAGTPEAFRQYIGDELKKWRKVATDIGISVE
ncbi:tripartite tricarboxylate transporter substrate binding protein [Bordetella sp. BOR01]|uniref:Bug family tripartite tricarboxylate transporter substrate binding protein n=1 Tax=Bordetella sp. BOR01 TaxID=2854779 RepID=UPI001C44D0DB|nr:tripartite tricarboxylate transporter substrate binding protein [Bordetella sp. BOR01]MBV7485578.1 tripartite tricarboxylate transporter substrate binding protein [Bordetella sp. BOR01]